MSSTPQKLKLPDGPIRFAPDRDHFLWIENPEEVPKQPQKQAVANPEPNPPDPALTRRSQAADEVGLARRSQASDEGGLPTPTEEVPAPQPKPTHRSQAAGEADHHSRKCRICAHPDRDSIDLGFLHWRSPENIALEYGVTAASIYRHAHATGLFARRVGKIRHALEFIIEHAERCMPSADAIIRAVRAYTSITDDGKWVEHPKHVVFTSHRESAATPGREESKNENLAEAHPDAPAGLEKTDNRNGRADSRDTARAPHVENSEFLIENSTIRKPPQPFEKSGHSQILIENPSGPPAPPPASASESSAATG